MKTYTTSLLIISLMALTACSSNDKSRNNETMLPSAVSISTEEVSLGGIPTGLHMRKLNDESKDLRKIVELAIARSDNGEHSEAGEVFLKAFNTFSSSDKTIEQALISAAIVEFFQAGKIAKTRECLASLDTFYSSAYNNFDTDKSVAIIRKIVSNNQ